MTLGIARRFDAAGRDERNRALGRAGEALALAHECAVLKDAGRDDLAREVRWVSQEEGDGAGYDIASFAPDGRTRLLEVKTTRGWDRTPFYISRNELARVRGEARGMAAVPSLEFLTGAKGVRTRPAAGRSCLPDAYGLSGALPLKDNSSGLDYVSNASHQCRGYRRQGATGLTSQPFESERNALLGPSRRPLQDGQCPLALP